MPDSSSQGGSPKAPSKPTTRSSIRQSLNLASVGKALIAGVRSKDSTSDEPKLSKKSKDLSRRQSVTPQPSAGPRASSVSGDSRPAAKSTKPDAKPEKKIVTRRRVSGQNTRSSADEMARASDNNATPTGPAAPTTRSYLRPKGSNVASALPKPRSRTTDTAPAKPSSPAQPAKVGARRRPSSSSDDEGGKEQRKPEASQSVADRNTRPISPLPQRAALKASSAINATPPTTPSTPTKLKSPSPTVHRNGSPTRPTKLMKTTTHTISTRAIPRPSSAGSNNATPRTPKAHSSGSALRAALQRSAQDKTKTGTTPLSDSPLAPFRNSPSPLSRRVRKNSKSGASSSFSSSLTGSMNNISEAMSEDSDEEDVQRLLAPTASPTAETPSMPRIHRTSRRNIVHPETPSKEKPAPKPTLLMPPSSRTGSSSRVPKSASSSNDRTAAVARASILSWEHASLSASQHLGPGEADKMLYDVPAPFSGPTSPTTSHVDLPPSPSLSAIDSPGLGFGSISQVLLPEVTPSPAVHLSTRFSVSPEAAGDSSSMYLRLQLAAAEELSTERAQRIRAMEEEIQDLKGAHLQQMEEFARHVQHRERSDQQAGYIASLEDQIRALRVKGERDIQEVRMQVEEEARKRSEAVVRAQRRKMDAVFGSVMAGTAWNVVKDAAEVELETVRGERHVLSLLLMELEALTPSL